MVERIVDTIRGHYAEAITLRHLGRSIGRHPNYIGNVFRQEMGITVRTYLTRTRLECAAGLIARGEKIEAVGLCVGYKSKNHFYRQFKRHYGVTPAEYRAERIHGGGGRSAVAAP
jgi:two-component system, response regulator YesN